MMLITVNAVCGKRKSVKTIIIGDTTNLTVDINRFRKKYKGVVLKDKDYKWAYSRYKGCYFGGGGLKYFTKIILIRSGLERTTNHKLDGELFQFWYFQLQRAVIM